MPPSATLVRRQLRASDLFVAADGGANNAFAMGLRPDVIIGDLDSIRPSVLKAFASSVIIQERRQDNTDLEKALDVCVAEHVDNVVILGATGGRLDMTLGNLFSVWKYSGRIGVCFAGDGWLGFPVRGRSRFRATPGTIVSLIPCGTCRGITLTGLAYPLVGAVLDPGGAAVSNVVRKSPFAVACSRGNLLVIILDDRAEKL